MSWGLDIHTKDEDGNEEIVEVVDGHTYNLTPMWYKALPDLGVTKDLDGQQCSDILPSLKLGLFDIELKTDEYKALNPDNGWGDFKGFREVYIRFARLCEAHPSGIIRWNG